MGQVNTEQAVAIIDAVADAVDAAQPDVVQQVQSEPNYWWLLSLAVIPVFLGYWLNNRKKMGVKK